MALKGTAWGTSVTKCHDNLLNRNEVNIMQWYSQMSGTNKPEWASVLLFWYVYTFSWIAIKHFWLWLDLIKWKHFPRYWPFVRGIHRSPVDSPHKGHWRGALMFSLIWAWTNGWVNKRDAGDLRRHRAHYDVSVMAQQVDIILSSFRFKEFSSMHIYILQ